MTVIAKESIKCGKCNAEYELPVLHSLFSFGFSDLDFRLPRNGWSNQNDLIVQECARCGYTNWNLAEDNGISKEYLKKVKYRNKVLGALRFGRTLHQFHMLYNEMTGLNNISEAYAALLYATWCCDDSHRIIEALHYRRKLVKLFKQLPENEKNDEGCIARHIDIMRRACMFKKVLKQYADFKPKDNNIKKLINYQFELCKRSDPRRHIMDEIEEMEE